MSVQVLLQPLHNTGSPYVRKIPNSKYELLKMSCEANLTAPNFEVDETRVASEAVNCEDCKCDNGNLRQDSHVNYSIYKVISN
jgi:hypothetical protein